MVNKAVAIVGTAVCGCALLVPSAEAVVVPEVSIVATAAALDDGLEVLLALDPAFGWPGGAPATATVGVRQTFSDGSVAISARIDIPDPLVLIAVNGCDDDSDNDLASCLLDDMAQDEQRSFTASFFVSPTATAGSYPVTVNATGPDFQVEASAVTRQARLDPVTTEATQPFEVRELRVSVVPAVAKPGDVVTVLAESLPPGSVTLQWSAGLSPAQPYPTTGLDAATGRWPVLILRHDRLGHRDLTVHSVDGLFTDVVVANALLVVPRPAAAPRMVGRG